MIDTIKLVFKQKSGAPRYAQVLEELANAGFVIKPGGRYRTLIRRPPDVSDDCKLPLGTLSVSTLGRWSAEVTPGEVLHGHNAFLLSFGEAEDAICRYAESLRRHIPYVDVDTAQAARVDIYYQWRLLGDWDFGSLYHYLGDYGPCTKFQVFGKGQSARLWRSNYCAVRLYNKSGEVAFQKAKRPDSPAAKLDMPDGVYRLEVDLRDRRVRKHEELRLSQRDKSLTAINLRDSRILVSSDLRVPVDGSPIFNRTQIIKKLAQEWPGVLLSPVENASELISGNIVGSTALILHDVAYTRYDYLRSRAGNRTHVVTKLREAPLRGSGQAWMRIPDPARVDEAYADRASNFYLNEVLTQKLPDHSVCLEASS